MTEPQLPALHQAELDAEELAALARDLSCVATIHSCRVKQGPRHMSEETTLAEGFARLSTGAALALQIDYIHEDRRWRDTLVRARRGSLVRLIRMAGA